MADDRYTVELLIEGNNRLTATVDGVQRDLSRIDRSMDGLRRTNQNVTQGFSQLQGIMSAGLFGVGLQQAVQFVGEMNELGATVNRAESTFLQFGGSIDVMRTATRGVVDDLTLMQAANSLLITGLAQSSEEAARFTNIAVTLGGALGQGPADAIQNLNAAILNMSYERLDSLGISAANVRARVNELKEAGQGAEDAFKTAVFEQADIAIARLGDTIEGNISAMDRMSVRWQNSWQDMSQQVAVSVNEIAIELNKLAEQADENEATRRQLAEFGVTFNPGQTATQRFFGQNPLEWVDQDTRTNFEAWREAEAVRNAAEEWARQAIFATRDSVRGFFTSLMSLTDEEANAARRTAANMSAWANRSREQLGANAWDIGALRNQGTRGAIGGVELFSTEELARAEEYLSRMQSAYADLALMEPGGLVTEDDLKLFDQMVNRAETFRDEIQKGADALRNMTLPEGLGEGGGGMLGQLGDQVLAALKTDMEDSEFQTLEDAMGLASGRLTEASLTMRDEILPMLVEIFNAYGSEALIGAMQGVEGAIKEGNLRGRSPEEIAASLGTATGYVRFGGGAGGSPFTVNPGDTISGIAAMLGVSQAEAMRLTGTTDPRRLQPGTYGRGGGGALVPDYAFDNPSGMWGMGMGGFQGVTSSAQETAGALEAWVDPLDTAFNKATEIQGVLDNINATTFQAEIELTVKDPANILGILTGSSPLPPGITAATVIRQATRDNGGRPPGQSGRVRTEN